MEEGWFTPHQFLEKAGNRNKNHRRSISVEGEQLGSVLDKLHKEASPSPEPGSKPSRGLLDKSCKVDTERSDSVVKEHTIEPNLDIKPVVRGLDKACKVDIQRIDILSQSEKDKSVDKEQKDELINDDVSVTVAEKVKTRKRSGLNTVVEALEVKEDAIDNHAKAVNPEVVNESPVQNKGQGVKLRKRHSTDQSMKDDQNEEAKTEDKKKLLKEVKTRKKSGPVDEIVKNKPSSLKESKHEDPSLKLAAVLGVEQQIYQQEQQQQHQQQQARGGRSRAEKISELDKSKGKSTGMFSMLQYSLLHKGGTKTFSSSSTKL